MVAKINRGVSLYGAITYNHDKVTEQTARIISGNRMITNMTENPDHVMRQTLLSFDNYLLANKNTDKPILHISLNPTTDDRLTDEQFAALAKDYMERMGYGDQPYIVYLHEDIARRHIHIVSTCVDENGSKISDKFEWNRSMKACRELEAKYNLTPIANKEKELEQVFLQKVDYSRGDLKQQVANTLKSVFAAYRFQSFGEYSALLACYGIEAKQVKGEHDGTPYNGIVYSVLDDKGKAVGVPIKSSLIDKKFGFEGVAKRIKHNADDFTKGKWSPKIRNEVALAMHGCRHDREQFEKLLRTQNIDVLFRENDDGRIYGVTFIDHDAKEVYNGSRLGKEFSANAFSHLFTELSDEPQLRNTADDASQQNTLTRDLPASAESLESAIEEAFGLFSFDTHGTDPEEERFRRQMQRKKKKKQSHSRGIS